jgi:hypothetical protein
MFTTVFTCLLAYLFNSTVYEIISHKYEKVFMRRFLLFLSVVTQYFHSTLCADICFNISLRKAFLAALCGIGDDVCLRAVLDVVTKFMSSEHSQSLY